MVLDRPAQLFLAKARQSLREEDIEERSDEMPYSVYILECSDGSYYVGCTNNLDRHLKQHNDSKWGARYTRMRRPVTMKYQEKFETLVQARRREKEIKGWKREKKERLWSKK